jgi:hypothetical protein
MWVWDPESRIQGSKGTESRIRIHNTAVLREYSFILPSLARLEVKEEGIVVDESGGDSLVQELGMPIKNKNKITNYSSLPVLLHKKNYIGSCFIHYPQH